MVKTLKKAVLITSMVASFASIAPAEEPLLQQQSVKPGSFSTDQKQKDDTDSMLILLSGMVAAGLIGTYLLTRKGKMFDD